MWNGGRRSYDSAANRYHGQRVTVPTGAMTSRGMCSPESQAETALTHTSAATNAANEVRVLSSDDRGGAIAKCFCELPLGTANASDTKMPNWQNCDPPSGSPADAKVLQTQTKTCVSQKVIPFSGRQHEHMFFLSQKLFSSVSSTTSTRVRFLAARLSHPMHVRVGLGWS